MYCTGHRFREDARQHAFLPVPSKQAHGKQCCKKHGARGYEMEGDPGDEKNDRLRIQDLPFTE